MKAPLRSFLRVFALAAVCLSLLGLLSWRPSYEIRLGGRQDKFFALGWEPAAGESGHRVLRENAMIHLHGLERGVGYLVRMTWRSSNRSGRPDTVRIALNGRRPVTLRASTRLRTDRFEVPAAPEDCLILRFHPSVEDEIEVRTISVDPLASRTQPPLGWIFSILAVPIALSFIPIRHGTVLALIVALASTIVGFVVWRPFAYLYALLHHPLAVMTVQFACLAVVFFLSRAWLEARGTRRWLGATIVLGASVLLTYAHTLAFGFVWDDFAFIRPPSWDLMGSSFTGSWMTTRFMPHYYRPLVVALYSLDYLLYGTWAIGYHLTNLLCLILGSLLVFRLLERFIPRPHLCLGAALLFALHPLNYIAASWISQRTDLLAGIFYLATLVLWPHRRLWAHLTAVAAYLSKEIAVTLPATVFLLDLALGHVSLRRPRLRALVTRYGVFLAIWLGYLAFLWWRFPNVSRFAAELGSGQTFGTSEVANVALPARMLNIVTLVVLTPFQSWIRVDRLSGILTALLGVGVLVGIASVLSRWSWPDEPVTRQRAARLIPLGLIWIVVTSAPILKASGFAFYRMGTLVSVGASLCALAVLYGVFGPEARRLRKVVGLTLFLSWLGALWVESVQGSLDLDPYSRHMVEVNAYEYRAWSPYMPRATVRALQLRASGRQDHTWPIYRRDPPETYGETVSAP